MALARKHFILFIILFIAFIEIMGVGLVYPMFSTMLFNQEYAIIDPTTVESTRGFYLGVLLSIMPLTQFFSSPILGMLSDAKGRRRVLMWCLVAGIIGYAVAVLGVKLSSLPILLFSRVIVGISAGGGAVLSAALADLSTEQEKANHFGLFNMAFGAGFAVGPFLGGQLCEYGMDVPFWMTGCAILVNLALVFFFFPETHILKKTLKITWSLGLRNLKKAFSLPGLRAVFFASFFACLGWSFYWEFIPVTWIADYAMGPKEIGQVYAYGAAIYALSTGLLIRPIAGRFQPQVILFYALASSGAYILLSLWHFPQKWLWAYIPLQQYLIAFFFPTCAAFISNNTGKDSQGEMLGILQSVESFGFALSPLIAGILVGWNKDAPIVVGGIAMLTGAAILGLLLRTTLFRKDTLFLRKD